MIMGKQQDISRVIFPGRDLGAGGWGDEAGLGLKLNEMIVRHGLACGKCKRSWNFDPDMSGWKKRIWS